MRGVFGRRTVTEAVFLVAVPVGVLAGGQSKWVIVASAALAYLLVLFVEIGVWRNRPNVAPADAVTPAAKPPETVRVLSHAPEPVAEPEPAPELEPAPAPEPEPAPAPAPPVTPEPEPAHVRVLRPAPALEPDPAPEPLPAAAEPETVVPIGVGAGPREWNLWDLEKLVRAHAGRDEARDEERSFLLMYLRDFAGPDGMLPIDFDGLVRDSFGDLVGAR
jgi:hypothetical protein